MDYEIRDFEIRSVNNEKREVTGLAVPYDTVVNVGGFSESFERGAIDSIKDVKLFWNHEEPIGKVVRGEEIDGGYEVTAVISTTDRGNEAYTLLKDGVINKFSVGFVPVEHRMDEETIIRTKVQLKEVSLVPFPAYEDASVMSVRSKTEITNYKEDIMSEDTNYAPESEVADIRETVTDLERRFSVFTEGGNRETAVDNRSGGELLKALASGDETAKRAFTGATLADADGGTRPGWVNRTLRLVEENRPTVNLFERAALPASGNSIEYPFVSATTGTVEEQAAEGDDLAYMEVALDTATAPVRTYGGYSSLSRQAIERSDMAYLETVLRYQTLQYAKATETAVRTALVGAAGVGTGTLAADTAAGWIDTVFDAAAAIEDNSRGATAEFVLVSRDVFRRVSHMVDSTGRPLFVINGDGVNSLGNINLRGVSANIAGFPVVVGTALPANTMLVASREAMTVFENPGAPVRLQDENVINLTKDFSLYGYMAVAVTNPLAIVRVDADLV